MKKIINTKAAPAAIGPYSQGVSFGNLVMTSGQLPLDPTTMAFPEGGVREQTRQSLLNLNSQDACSTQHGRDKHYHAFPVSFVDNKPSKHLEQKSKYKRKRGHPTDICP